MKTLKLNLKILFLVYGPFMCMKSNVQSPEVYGLAKAKQKIKYVGLRL